MPVEQVFKFTLVNIHTDPDEVPEEMAALDDVFVAVQAAGADDDVILLGDLNADERHLGELGELPITAAITGVPTNTRKTKSYDNIIFDGRATTEYTGQFGVLDLMTEFALTKDEALVVSDHMPVWAVFSAVEGGAGVTSTAARPEPDAGLESFAVVADGALRTTGPTRFCRPEIAPQRSTGRGTPVGPNRPRMVARIALARRSELVLGRLRVAVWCSRPPHYACT